jgi:hypothetical protein
MTDRPSFTTLVDYVEGRLTAEAAARVERTLATADPQTRSALAWIRTFHDVADRLPLTAPPLRVRSALRREFEEHAARGAPLARSARRLLALLTFDSRSGLAVAGVRSGDSAASVTSLAFSCEAADVLVDLTPAGEGRLRLDGQVLWPDDRDARLLEARLTGPGFAEETQDSDALGRFAFARVPTSVDRLLLRAGDVDIELAWEPGGTP